MPACQDGSDNDFDGFVDSADFDCRESTPETCQDDLDNDGDGDVDLDDLDCHRCQLTGAQVVGNSIVGVNQAVTLTGWVSPTSAAGPLSYAWSGANLQSSITATAVYSWPAAGLYQVAFTVTNWCKAVTATHAVTVTTDPVVGFGSSAYAVGEGEGSANITVILDAASTQTVTVGYATSDGTATAGSDYVTVTGTLTLTPGITVQNFTVSILDDALDEATETVSLTLSNASNAIIGGVNPVTLAIWDDDGWFYVYLPLVIR